MLDEKPVHGVILTGGRSSRMGGRHKPGIEVGGSTVIDRTLTALWDAAPEASVVIAGTDEGISPDFRAEATVVREDPPFSGPLAGVAAALDVIPASDGAVLLLGGDLPFLSSTTMSRLIASVADGADLVSCRDETGHLQFLCSGWRAELMRDQLAAIADPANVPLKALFAGLEPALIECDPDELRDVDTPEDLARAVTTSDGRPVPTALLAVTEQFNAQFDADPALTLSAHQTAKILDFAREVKYSPTVVNPVVAAFLAGQLAGSCEDVAADEALQCVLAFILPDS